MLIHWLWLATRENLPDHQKAALLEQFHDAEDVYYAEPAAFQAVEGLTAQANASLQDKNLRSAQKILDDCLKKNIGILTFRDAAYPTRLKNIADPPVVLYYKGRLLDFDGEPLIGVVGTRKASAYGLTVAKRMGYQVAACGGTVVSGVASGIDAMAMGGALTAGMPVVGILGCGADIVYPLSNKALFRDIERHGCLLTEFPPETPPYKWNFPKRNRIISGMSCGVLVVEAPKGSGALITARQAGEQGRDVFVVPGNIDVDTCAGSNALLRDGAIAASSGWEVMGEYAAQFPDKIHKDTSPARQRVYPDEVPQTRVAQKPRLLDKFKKEKPESPEVIEPPKAQPSLTEQQRLLIELIGQGNTLVDDLISAAQLPAATVLSELTLLQILGVVKAKPGKRVELQK